jgi:hypothetical protein
VLIVFGLYLIVLKILFEKGFEKKENKTKQKRKLEIGKKKRKEASQAAARASPFPLASAQCGPGSPRADFPLSSLWPTAGPRPLFR